MTALVKPETASWPRLAALSLAILLPSLSTSITNVALPELSQSFGAPMPEVQWVVIAYLIAVTSFILGAGRLGDLFGRRRLLLSGTALFVIASAASSCAPSLWALVATRAAQGIGASAMLALTVAMVGDMVPTQKTGSVIGLLGTVSAIGTALGPTLGGVLLSHFGWPALFVVLSLAGTLALVLGYMYFPADAELSGKRTSVDVPGIALLALALSFLSATLTLGAALSGGAVAALSGVSFLAFVIFVLHERATPAPLLRLALLRDRRFASGLLAMLLVSAIVMTTLVVGPFHLSQTLGLGPAATGLVMSLGPLVAALTGVPAGRLVDRLGTFRISLAGLAVLVAGAVLMTTVPHGFGWRGYAEGLALITAGYALFQAANTTSMMERASSDTRGITSALVGLARNLGFILGASAMGTIYTAMRLVVPKLADPSGVDAAFQITFFIATGLGLSSAAIVFIGTRD